MNRGPALKSRPAGMLFVDKAIAAWGSAVPDWIRELAALADAEGLRGAGDRIGYHASAVSMIVNGKYQGDIGRVEQMVRGALMAETVDCPMLGTMARNVCLEWQGRPYTDSSALHIRMHRACASCAYRRAS